MKLRGQRHFCGEGGVDILSNMNLPRISEGGNVNLLMGLLLFLLFRPSISPRMLRSRNGFQDVLLPFFGILKVWYWPEEWHVS